MRKTKLTTTRGNKPIRWNKYSTPAEAIFFWGLPDYRKKLLAVVRAGLKPVHQMTEAEWNALPGWIKEKYPSSGASWYNTNYYIMVLHEAVKHGVALSFRVRESLSPGQINHLNYIIRETFKDFPKGKYPFGVLLKEKRGEPNDVIEVSLAGKSGANLRFGFFLTDYHDDDRKKFVEFVKEQAKGTPGSQGKLSYTDADGTHVLFECNDKGEKIAGPWNY